MSDAILKVEPLVTDRSEIEAARAAPVSLPAGSFDASDLSAILGETSKAKHDKDRDELIPAAVEKLNEAPIATSGGQPGYKRVEVQDEVSGVTEFRTVFDPQLGEQAADEADKALPEAAPARASKGE